MSNAILRVSTRFLLLLLVLVPPRRPLPSTSRKMRTWSSCCVTS